jgi:hypothetical protein
MNIRRGLFRLWIVVSAAWMLGSGIIWYRNFAPEQAQIAALDECGKIYPPLPEGLVPVQPSLSDQLAAAAAGTDPLSVAEKQHPQCAPNVGTISFEEFVSMHEPDREALRQNSENGIRSDIQDAVVFGAGVPVGLLAFGLIAGWIIRGFREGHPR